MKQRFTSLDIRATVVELKPLIVGLRLQNIYDINSKTFLFKFGKPNKKELVLIESGTRIHTTQYSRDKNITPSSFCIKLRKHLRARILTDVRQLGMDRIIDFVFSTQAGEDSEGTYHIISEYYALGNVILTDHEYKILSLLRVVSPDESTKFAVGQTYDIKKDQIQDLRCPSIEEIYSTLQESKPNDILSKCLEKLSPYGPTLVDHISLKAGLDPKTRVSTGIDLSQVDLPHIKALQHAYSIVYDQIVNKPKESFFGLITYTGSDDNEGDKSIEEIPGKSNSSGGSSVIYNQFQPILLEQFVKDKRKEYPTFMEAVDEFYSRIEAQKLKLKAQQQEKSAIKKLQAIQSDHYGRVVSLEKAQEKADKQARLIETNVDLVEQTIMLLRNAIAAGLDWKELEEIIKQQKEEGHPIAMAVKRLQLKYNRITVLLEDFEENDSDDSDSDGESSSKRTKLQGPMEVDIDINISAHANAKRYYSSKKQNIVKHKKTVEVSEKVLKSAEQKIRQDMKQAKIQTNAINQIRKPLWFEKFLWFITSDGYLVIAGHDMQQNELIVKKYLKPGDAYVHADLNGAASVVVKNSKKSAAIYGDTIPPTTLFQAGIMSVCESRAWDAKIVTSAWWVEAHQVSKTAPTGEYLTTGSFMIRGKKHFLPPVQLVYGFGFIFKLGDDESIARHVKARSEKHRIAAENRAKQMEIETARRNTESALAGDGGDVQDPEENSANDEALIINNDCSEKTPSIENNKVKAALIAADSVEPKQITKEDSALSVQNFEEARQKYDLDEYEQGQSGSDDEFDKYGKPKLGKGYGSSKKVETRRYISAKERRDMKKKNKKGDQDNSVGDSGNDINNSNQQQKGKPKKKEMAIVATGKSKSAKGQDKTNLPPTQPKRGKKGKKSKGKQDYFDNMDEEEILMRQKLLGEKTAKDTIQNQGKNDAEDNSVEEDQKELETKMKKINLDDSSEKQKEGKDRSIDKHVSDDDKDDKEQAEVERIMEEENIAYLEDEEMDTLDLLDTLTSNPLPGDTITHAIPVCAPYAALTSYRYRVKLTPGTMKKGKAAKAAVSVFLQSAPKKQTAPSKPKTSLETHDNASNTDSTEDFEYATKMRELDLIKNVPDQEMIAQIIGKCKVSAPHMEAIKQQQKKAKKKSGGKK
ncbi:hypothetical protein H4219_002117 [Mycoemilia scoparia]|uniref:NFACT RNA-binding domain-containing protein n=1 Tax=Mycoemilia scoparia TaxID=417184 RepID=A0A9W8A220_9FUNG|nr:hypothetical protein H4219_002117 [Mycoemilia scoparia]